MLINRKLEQMLYKPLVVICKNVCLCVPTQTRVRRSKWPSAVTRLTVTGACICIGELLVVRDLKLGVFRNTECPY